MNITSQTGIVGLLGHPVSHSKSPEIMNAALQQLELPYVYVACDVEPTELAQVVARLRACKWRGWNVTIPHKVNIIPYLDRLDASAAEIGAVNTVVNQAGELVGYNTDGAGYVRSLTEENNLLLSEQRVVIIGAGGAARAVGYALATAGVKQITVINRTLAKAEELAHHLSQWTQTSATAILNAQREVEVATLVINTTSVGMSPHIDVTPINPMWLQPHHIVSDLVYHPRHTALLQGAQTRGAVTHTGLGMLLHQAAIAFELWFHQPAPIQLMRRVLENSLK